MSLHQPTAIAAPLNTIPFIGCADTGMAGGPAPTAPAIQIALPASIASKLAVYAGGQLATLGPRGWTCAAEAGTSGSILSVFPGSAYSLSGPAVSIISADGGNPGAEAAVIMLGGRFFPKFVSKDEIDAFQSSFPADQSTQGQTSIFPIRKRDRITYISPKILAFKTPAFYAGLGASLVATEMSGDFGKTLKFPSSGLIRIFTQGNQAFAIETMVAALPINQSNLTAAIVAYAKSCITRYVLNGPAPYCGIAANYAEAAN